MPACASLYGRYALPCQPCPCAPPRPNQRPATGAPHSPDSGPLTGKIDPERTKTEIRHRSHVDRNVQWRVHQAVQSVATAP
jgi:hypothetical protein